MKNKLSDLNDHLFSQLERLNDEELSDDDLQKEIGRSQAVSQISKEIIGNARLQLDAIKLKAEYQGLSKDDLPALLDHKK